MNNECTANQRNHGSGITYKCNLYKDHSGDHRSLSKHGEVMQRWPRQYANYSHVVDEEVAAIKKQATVLELTLHELAELYVILSGNHDIPEVYLNKVAAALKEAL